MNYTKGEWNVDRGNSFDTIVYLASEPHRRIASFSTGASGFSGEVASKEEGEGNLNLFLGAPDMYEALKAVYTDVMPERRISFNTLDKVQKILTKVEGKEE